VDAPEPADGRVPQGREAVVDVDIDDLVAETGEQIGGIVDRVAADRRQRDLGSRRRVRRHGDAERGPRPVDGVTKGGGSRGDLDGVEKQGRVTDRAGQGSEHDEAVPSRGVFGPLRHPVALRFEADETREGGAIANGSATVAAQGHRGSVG